MQCKVDHTEPGTFPAEWCRTCHPDLIPTATERVALDRADVERYAKAEAERIRERALISVDNKIKAMVRKGEPLLSSVPGKILASLRKKRATLEAA